MRQFLRNFIDGTSISETELDKFSYSTDASRFPGSVEMVIWPKNVDELQRVCHIASRHNITVTPRGAGCNLVGGAVPDKSIVIDMCKMNRILEITGEYAYVEAGVVIKDLNDALKPRQFPIIPLNSSVATVGGLIASNSFCSRTSEIGRVIDWLLEIEVVDGTGKFHKLTGNEMRHFAGLEGTTGVIAKAKLRLETHEKNSFSIMGFNTIDAMTDFLKEKDNQARRTDILDDITSGLLGFDQKMHIIGAFPEGLGKAKEEDIEEIFTNLDWKLKRKGYLLIEAPKIPEENIEKMIYWLRKNSVPNYLHLGCNIFVCYFKENSRELETFKEVVKGLNGDLSHGFGFGMKYKPNNEDRQRIMMLKETYDPKNIMNKGKLA